MNEMEINMEFENAEISDRNAVDSADYELIIEDNIINDLEWDREIKMDSTPLLIALYPPF